MSSSSSPNVMRSCTCLSPFPSIQRDRTIQSKERACSHGFADPLRAVVTMELERTSEMGVASLFSPTCGTVWSVRAPRSFFSTLEQEAADGHGGSTVELLWHRCVESVLPCRIRSLGCWWNRSEPRAFDRWIPWTRERMARVMDEWMEASMSAMNASTHAWTRKECAFVPPSERAVPCDPFATVVLACLDVHTMEFLLSTEKKRRGWGRSLHGSD